MTGPRHESSRAGARGARILARVALSGVTLATLYALALVPSASALSCDDTYETTGPWSTAANWSKAALPGAGEVACVKAGQTVTLNAGTQKIQAIQGGNLAITGGVLELQSAVKESTLEGLTISSGRLTGVPSKIALAGNFEWKGTASSSMTGVTIAQSGSHVFSITEQSQKYAESGVVFTTGNPVTISDLGLISAETSSLTTTGTVTFAPGPYTANGSQPLTISAAGFITSGKTAGEATELLDFGLHLTGNSSSLVSSLSAQQLSTDPGTTLSVSAGATLSPGSGTISGTVSGAGSLNSTGTLSLASGGNISTAVTIPVGKLNVLPGAKYQAASTAVAGTLNLEANSSTGNLTFTKGRIQGNGSPTLTASGNFEWKGTESSGTNGVTIAQSGAHVFSITETSQKYAETGSIYTTENPVTISDLDFISAEHPSLTTSSTVTFTAGKYVANGNTPITISAAGFITSGTTEVVDYALSQSNGTTTVPVGTTLNPQTFSISGGTTQIDGTLTANTTVIGGTVKGTGTINGSLLNNGGTVAPGDSPGTLKVQSSYTQSSGGTLKIAAEGTGPGQYSKLEVLGAVNLAGNLEVAPGAAYSKTAAAKDLLGILPYSGSLTGSFSLVSTNPALEHGLAIAEAEGSGVVNAEVVAPTAPEASTPPTITGGTVAGETLEAHDGTWIGVIETRLHQWERCSATGGECSEIAGATGQSYVTTAADVGHKIVVLESVSNQGGRAGPVASAPFGPIQPVPVTPPAGTPPPQTPLLLQCSNKEIELVNVLVKGRSVYLSGIALTKYAGQKVTITLSNIPRKLAKGRGGTTTVAPDGTFQAKLKLPLGRLAPLTRYTATVAGHASLGLKLGRELVITSEQRTATGLKVTLRGTGNLAHGSHAVTIARQVSCTHSEVFEKVTLKGGALTVALPAPAEAGAVSYYRAQTPVAGKQSYSLPIAVKAAS